MPNLNNLTTQDLQWGTANWSGQGYIDGLKMVWDSATSISVTSGAAFIPSLSKCLPSPSTLTLSGLTLTASTWYHVYFYSNAGTPAIECVTTAPAAPYSGTARTKTGDTSRRYVGSVVTNASGNLYRFVQSGTVVRYLENTSSGAFYLVASGASTATATVSASGVIPVTARIAALSILNSATNSDVTLSNSEANVTLPTGYILFAFRGTAVVVDMALDSSQAYQYAYTTTPSGGYSFHRCFGYTFER